MSLPKTLLSTLLAPGDSDSLDASFTAPQVKTATPFHIILQVQDDGTPSLFAYRRAIVTVTP